jgi:hypothetical protein
VQGYLISRPLPYEAIRRFLDDRRDFAGTDSTASGELSTHSAQLIRDA